MDDVEDGEVSSGGFLGDHEIAARKALAAVHGEGTGISWVEAVLTGAGAVNPDDGCDDDHDDVDDHSKNGLHKLHEPPPPGTSAEKPPPSAAALARREAALVHRVMALLGEEDAAGKLLMLLAEAGEEGVAVPKWLGHGRSSNRGRMPLMEAAMQGRTACTAALAEAACACSGGRGLNSRNERGKYSALHYACHHGHTGAALELLVRGADPRLRNQAGETALQAAIANGRTDCAELVRDFLRRPTFEPDEGTPPPPSSLPPSPATALPSRPSSQPAAARIGLGIVTKGEGDEIGVRAAVGGVAAVAPEVSRANTVFCLGRRRRRLGASVRPGRGLGVGVGTAAAEVSLGARRRARLHSANPCVGTSMEAFVLWSIASGQDPFHGEGGVEDSDSDKEGGNKANEVWLDYYVRVYNASVRRWYYKQESTRRDHHARQDDTGAAATSAAYVDTEKNQRVATAAAAFPTPSKYALVVEKSTALAEGRRFDLPCGREVVIGRSQHLADIVVKDEMVSKTHLRIEVSAQAGFRVHDLKSKHGAVITKPAPPAKKPPPKDAPPPPPKFFPIPIPHGPEWVAGAHGDRITLGKTTFVVEREGGREPLRMTRPPRRTGPAGGETTVGEVARRVVESKRPAAVISKRFTANPNLLEAIRSAEEMERARKRKAAASEVAAAAAAEYLNNSKRARSSAASGSSARLPVTPPTVGAHSLDVTATAVAAAAAGPENIAGNQQAQGTGCGSDTFEHVSKGSMLLRRMGWTEGQGLGRRSDGQLQPVQVERRGEREGLGTEQAGNNPFAIGADGRISKWEQMRRRFTLAQRSSGAGYRERARRPAGGGWLQGGVEGGHQ